MNKSSPQRDPHKKKYLVNSEGFKSSYLLEIEPSKTITALIKDADALRHNIEYEIKLSSDKELHGNEERLEKLGEALEDICHKIQNFPVNSLNIAQTKVAFLMHNLQYNNPEVADIVSTKAQILDVLEKLDSKSSS